MREDFCDGHDAMGDQVGRRQAGLVETDRMVETERLVERNELTGIGTNRGKGFQIPENSNKLKINQLSRSSENWDVTLPQTGSGVDSPTFHASLRLVLDTGASNHMSGCKVAFIELDIGVKGTMKFGNDSVVKICGRGTVLFTCHTQEHRELTGVYYIPRLQSNIISIG